MKYTIRKAINKKQITLIAFFILLSLTIGLLIAYFGQGKSFVEDKKTFITIILTLFGLGMTSAIFVAQTLDTINFDEKKAEKAYGLKVSLTKSLGLTAVLILISVIFEFISTAIPTADENSKQTILKHLPFILDAGIYSLFSYIIILQADVTACFLQIMKLRSKK